MLELPGLPVACFSGDTIEKFREESMVLIGNEIPNAEVNKARRFRVGFLVVSVVVAGFSGGVVLVSFFGEVSVFSET